MLYNSFSGIVPHESFAAPGFLKKKGSPLVRFTKTLLTTEAKKQRKRNTEPKDDL